MSTTHTATNFAAPWGAQIAYSRLCLAYEAAAALLEELTPLGAKVATDHQTEGLAAAFDRWEAAHRQHLETRAWAEAPAPAVEAARP